MSYLSKFDEFWLIARASRPSWVKRGGGSALDRGKGTQPSPGQDEADDPVRCAAPAASDLEEQGGDAAAIRCLEDGRAKGWSGSVLRHHVESRAKYFENQQQRATR